MRDEADAELVFRAIAYRANAGLQRWSILSSTGRRCLPATERYFIAETKSGAFFSPTPRVRLSGGVVKAHLDVELFKRPTRLKIVFARVEAHAAEKVRVAVSSSVGILRRRSLAV